MRKQLKAVFLDTVPVMTGYLFLGIGFGILMAEQTGKSFLWSLGMSLIVYTGACQYLTISLLASHASVLSAAIAAFVINARHIFYGLSLIDSYQGAPGKAYMIFGLTDETYSLVTRNQPPAGMSRQRYCLLVSVLDHLYWIAGCTLGHLAGNLLSIPLKGVEFVLTALFVTLFTEQWLTYKDHRPAIIGVGSTALCLMIFGKDIFLIPSMVLIAALLLIMNKTGRRTQDA